MTAKTRYDNLSSDRSQFLTEAEDATKLTLPYLIRGHEEYDKGMKQLKTPWQSVGAKGGSLSIKAIAITRTTTD